MTGDDFEGGWTATDILHETTSHQLSAERYASGYTSYAWVEYGRDSDGPYHDVIDMCDNPRDFSDDVPAAAIAAATEDFEARNS